jgi:hypothetical protein
MPLHQDIKVSWQYDTRLMIAHVQKALKNEGYGDEATEFVHQAFAAESPEQVYEIAEKWVELV